MSETDILEGGAVAEEATRTRRTGRLPDRCYACATPVVGPYCHACGQKNDDCRRSIAALAGESVRDVAALDGRLLTTVRALVSRPGRHLRDYGDGKRSPYTPPIRLFLVVSFLFFTTLWATDRQIVVFQPEVVLDDDGTVDIREWTGGFFVKPREVTYTPEEREAMLGAVQTDRASAAVESEVLRAEAEDEIALVRAETAEEAAALREAGAEAEAAQVEANGLVEIAEIRTALVEDLAEIDPAAAGRQTATLVMDELRAEGIPVGPGPGAGANAGAGAGAGVGAGAGAGGEGSDGTIVVNGEAVDSVRFREALFRLLENPRLFNNQLAEWIPRIMVLMIPLMALLGAVFIRGRDALLYDHALLSLTTHAIAFGLMTLGLWTAGLVPGWLFAWSVVLGVPFYYYRAARGAFGRSRRKTAAATVFVFWAYTSVLNIALLAAAVSAFQEML